MADTTKPLTIATYNCRGFNAIKSSYIASLMSKCSILFLQELWLADAQLSTLSSVDANLSYTGVSGFDNSEVLTGRPYGGCAILWHSALVADIRPIDIECRRVCAVRWCSERIKLLLINVYMPYEDGEDKSEEFATVLAVIEDVIRSNGDCHVVLGGDFNVDFSRNWVHTALLTSFCEDIGMTPIIRHTKCNIDYTYNFNMSRFSVLDHFILSGTLYDECISSAFVLHEVDNVSDHDPVFMSLGMDAKLIALSTRVFTPRVSWAKASDKDLNNYRSALSQNLVLIGLPAEALLCTNMCCRNAGHHSAIGHYAEAITSACLSAAESCIPHTSDRHYGSGRVPGWNEWVAPKREKSIFWHRLWVDCGRPRSGAVADCMRRTRANYHYAIRRVKREGERIVQERIVQALIADPSRSFWVEVKRIRSNRVCSTKIVDGCTDEVSIAELFAQKYRSLYSSVPYDTVDMQRLLDELDACLCDDGLRRPDQIFTAHDIMEAIRKLNPRKNDGDSNGLSTDHFLHAGPDLASHIAFLFTSMVTHGCPPREFGISTIIPIPKKHNINASDSNNFRGIALSSIFCKVFDNVVLEKYCNKLSTSDLQFGFKRKCSTHMCTMVLKETISYYVKNQSSVYCTFLDLSKAFDRVNFCKMFRLLVKKGLPPCIVRMLINLYTVSQLRVLWAGLYSEYFTAVNGVKQGGVLSPVLFCIYIDDLLIKLSHSGVGCYMGLDFVGALAYADDIVLLAPTPSAMRKMLSVCDAYAVDYDIVFNADKSKFLVIPSNSRRRIYSDMCQCRFFIGGNSIENVNQYTHLGHIITSSQSDTEDITHRRNCFVGQVNNVLCFFNKLDVLVKLKLFKSFCSSMFGSELWALDDDSIDIFCVAWRKALRRIFNLPYNTHSYLLPLISNTLPILDELSKRSARFITSCLLSPSRLVKSVSLYCVRFGRYGSQLGRNALFCCNRYGWSFDSFILNLVRLNNVVFEQWCRDHAASFDLNAAASLLDILFIRDGYSDLPNNFSFTVPQIRDIIISIATG
jgi:endonuclease/exonuclease/phosphatase family metal-dependent hydrolase